MMTAWLTQILLLLVFPSLFLNLPVCNVSCCDMHILITNLSNINECWIMFGCKLAAYRFHPIHRWTWTLQDCAYDRISKFRRSNIVLHYYAVLL